MDGGDKYHYAAHDMAYRDLERKCKRLEADYIISNRELLVKQVEIQRLTTRIAELEAENAEFRQLIRDWSIVLDQNNGFQLWHVESVRQAMLEINKERER